MYGSGNRSGYRRGRRGCLPWIIGILPLAILLIIWFQRMEWGTEHNATFTVKSLDDQSNGSSHKYLIFTASGQVYEDTDAYFHGKTDSSDIYGSLQAGHTYTCPVYGYRLHFPTSYPDILDGCLDITDPGHQVKVP